MAHLVSYYRRDGDNMDRLDLMRAFRAVSDEGSFVGAAEKLGRSNKQVSKQVAALENSLGVLLFQRTTRQVSLTEMGRAFLTDCCEILDRQEELWETISSQNLKVNGTLRVSAPLSFGEMKIAPTLPTLMLDYPELRIQLELSDSYVDLVDAGIDVAIRIGALQDSSLVVRKIGETNIVLVASPQYLAAHGEPNCPADLSQFTTIVDRNYRGQSRWPFVVDGQQTKIQVNSRIDVNSPAAAKLFALSHCGITMCPKYMVAQELQSGALLPVLQRFMPSSLGINIVYPSNKHLSPKVRVFSDYVARALRNDI